MKKREQELQSRCINLEYNLNVTRKELAEYVEEHHRVRELWEQQIVDYRKLLADLVFLEPALHKYLDLKFFSLDDDFYKIAELSYWDLNSGDVARLAELEREKIEYITLGQKYGR